MRFLKMFLLAVLLAGGLSLPVAAQSMTSALAGTTTATSDTLADYPADPLGRRTPRGMVHGYLDAMAGQNYERAAQYFDLSHFPAAKQGAMGIELAVNFQNLLDQNGGIKPESMLSDAVDGQPDDDLAPNLERVGGYSMNGDRFPVLAEKTKGPDGAPLWLISYKTIEQLPSQMPTAKALSLNNWLPAVLVENKWNGVPVGQWLAIPALGGIAYGLGWVISFVLLVFLARQLGRKVLQAPQIAAAFALPLRLFVGAWIFALGARSLGISILIRPYLAEGAIIVSWLATLVFFWRLVEVLTTVAERGMTRRGHVGAVSALLFLSHSLKVILVVVGVISTLNVLGFNVTAGLAALGIGGIALALGAQKTIENLVGSLNVVFDQPVRVGDFCKVGDVVGTIVEVGMRSTRIRTLDRTVVTMPNGDFSAQRIENYAHRDSFWYHPQINLKYDTTPEQVEKVLKGMRAVLAKHKLVEEGTHRVRFAEFGTTSLHLKVSAYIKVRDPNSYSEIQEELNLAFMDVVNKSGAIFATA